MGAGSLANTVCQSQILQLIYRLREQARSHTSHLSRLDRISRLTMQGFSGRFHGLFFRLAFHEAYMHLKNKHMKK